MKNINLTKAIKNKQEELRLLKQKRITEQEEYEKRISDYWIEEEGKFYEKLLLAEQAFKQLREFNEKHLNGIESLIKEGINEEGISESGIELMTYSWAHKGQLPRRIKGEWSRTYLSSKGFHYVAGYKVFKHYELLINKPQSLASNFTINYLTTLVQELANLEENLTKRLFN